MGHVIVGCPWKFLCVFLGNFAVLPVQPYPLHLSGGLVDECKIIVSNSENTATRAPDPLLPGTTATFLLALSPVSPRPGELVNMGAEGFRIWLQKDVALYGNTVFFTGKAAAILQMATTLFCSLVRSGSNELVCFPQVTSKCSHGS